MLTINNQKILLMMFFVLLLIMLPTAFAQVEYKNIGDLLVSHAQQSFAQVARFAMGIAYVMGAFFVILSISNFLAHKNAPAQNKLSSAIATAVCGCCLLYTPTLIGILGNTAYGEDSTSGYYGGAIFIGEDD